MVDFLPNSIYNNDNIERIIPIEIKDRICDNILHDVADVHSFDGLLLLDMN